jgi:hypothetical protein
LGDEGDGRAVGCGRWGGRRVHRWVGALGRGRGTWGLPLAPASLRSEVRMGPALWDACWPRLAPGSRRLGSGQGVRSERLRLAPIMQTGAASMRGQGRATPHPLHLLEGGGADDGRGGEPGFEGFVWGRGRGAGAAVNEGSEEGPVWMRACGRGRGGGAAAGPLGPAQTRGRAKRAADLLWWRGGGCASWGQGQGWGPSSARGASQPLPAPGRS